MKKLIGFSIFILMVFIVGFLFSSLIERNYSFNLLTEIKPKKLLPLPSTTPIAPKDPELFFKALPASSFQEFDAVYEKRRTKLKELISAGPKMGGIPPEVVSDKDMIRGQIESLRKVPIDDDEQNLTQSALSAAYQLLSETYDKEMDFLKRYGAEGANVSFITTQIVELSAHEQKSALQFMTALISYRKVITKAIRNSHSLEQNMAKMNDLMAINALIDKYQAMLNLPSQVIN